MKAAIFEVDITGSSLIDSEGKWIANSVGEVVQGEEINEEDLSSLVEESSCVFETINKEIKQRIQGEVKRGDIVKVAPFDDHRNRNKMIFDGQNFVPLLSDDSLDDEGLVPKQFLLNEFHNPLYWQEAIEHNRFVWADLSIFPWAVVDGLIVVDAWKRMVIVPDEDYESHRFTEEEARKLLTSQLWQFVAWHHDLSQPERVLTPHSAMENGLSFAEGDDETLQQRVEELLKILDETPATYL